MKPTGVNGRGYGRLDSVSIAGIAVFGALAVILTTLSQAFGLNFPLIPYLQFDLGELAILLAFFIFGPIPALVASFIEFVTLMVIGQNAPIGPVLKLIAILSSLLGIWVGAALAARVRRGSLALAVGSGSILGVLLRIVATTVANYYLIVVMGGQYALGGLVPYLAIYFKPIGISLNAANGLILILAFTAIFNGLQLILVSAASYLMVRLPQVQSTKAAGRTPWIIDYTRKLS